VSDGYFDGYEIKVIRGATGRKNRFEFYYGGEGAPDGPGHGHVVSNDGMSINYWREPNATIPTLDDMMKPKKLDDYGFSA
jgi:hypothetical protein